MLVSAPLSACSHSLLLRSSHVSPQQPQLLRHKAPCRPRARVASCTTRCSGHAQEVVAGSDPAQSRRGVLAATAGSILTAPLLWTPASLADGELQMYVDDVTGYKIKVPSEWTSGLGEATGLRQVVAFYPEGGTGETNVNIVVTTAAADYTKMGSFGGAFDFGTRLVGSLDRSAVGKKPKFMGGTGKGDPMQQRAELIDAQEKKGMYYVEYKVTKPGEYDRHFLSVVGLKFTGRFNRLYTVTGQANEGDFKKVKGTLKTVIDSFALPEGPSVLGM